MGARRSLDAQFLAAQFANYRFRIFASICDALGALPRPFRAPRSWLVMAGEFSGQAVIITGATKGIGRAMAAAFAAAGANIVATGRTKDALASICQEIEQDGGKAVSVVADLAAEDSAALIVTQALDAFGQIDVLVNNAAIIHDSQTLVEFDAELWQHVLQVNLVAPALLMKAALPHMIVRGYGKVVNISSIGGTRGGKGRSAYRAAKAGLINLTESVAAEVKEHGIDVNCICPGATDTEGFRHAFDHKGRQQDANLMESREIAELTLFLASSRASAITGTAINAFGATNPIFQSDSKKGKI
jgi:NAD(P)-dependent dehydrogenase (short-subunit alcohol dehydrogenase family)